MVALACCIGQGPHQSGQPFKFTVSESCDRIKEEFSFLQAQYHRFVVYFSFRSHLESCTALAFCRLHGRVKKSWGKLIGARCPEVAPENSCEVMHAI